MGNSNSTLANNGEVDEDGVETSGGGGSGGGGGGGGSSLRGNKYKVQVIDLDGRLHVDFKNRNLKKLKVKIFSSLLDTVEIVRPDSLNNSDYLKCRNTNDYVLIPKQQQQQQQLASTSHTTSTSPSPSVSGQQQPFVVVSATGDESSGSTTISKSKSSSWLHGSPSNSTPQSSLIYDTRKSSTEDPAIVNHTFMSSSPVPSPSSSPSKKYRLHQQLNPHLEIETLGEIIAKEQQQQEQQQQEDSTKTVSVSSEHIPESNKSNTDSSSTSTTTTTTTSSGTKPSINLNIANTTTNNSSGSSSKSSSKSSSSKSKSSSSSSKRSTSSSQQSSQSTNIVKAVPPPPLILNGKNIVIHTIDLSLNRLEFVQAEIFEVLAEMKVEEITFSTNFFSMVPPYLELIKTLTSLNFSRNKLNRFPIEVFSHLPNLSHITLDKNSISSLPDDIDKCKNLQYISMKHNTVDSLPASFCNLTKLKSIDFTHNKIRSLPNDFGKLTNLKSIWLSCNYIQHLPSMISMVNLTMVDLSSNRLQSISKDFAYLAPKAVRSRVGGIATGRQSQDIEEALIEGGGLGCLKEVNIRDNRDVLSVPLEYRAVESVLTMYTSLPTEIIPNLFLGGLDSANNASILQSLGITHIVLAIGDLAPYFPRQFKYYTIDDARDTPNYDLSVHFDQTTSFIEQGRKVGGVLVHCRAGISRSSTLIIAYLMKYQKLTYRNAFNFTQSKRPQIMPNIGFKDQLLKYENKLDISSK
ncbi:leucine-rich repeat-containing protein [Heterostelium album PN500]|uniref:protein-tyrosine-phosphatase n=1 Tax=Heterostelium pallidum (strain ATCC 26659 / Pp 5 / PN500) TaxID=670386 RepID=D3AWK8_HETP5|nr:leucine-rich repeat-containing protein [Heterostelium album PN500]EFA86681.1 leucine-rich repeat-containing protein [Heterostelium album PN500]|eukprot:XP_020438785.1 leucine-rich repeat-containing protein [Heterostelium album PN500]